MQFVNNKGQSYFFILKILKMSKCILERQKQTIAKACGKKSTITNVNFFFKGGGIDSI